MQRTQQIESWLTQVLPEQDFTMDYLAGDASFRRYARIHVANKSYMLMDAPPEKEDCKPFVTIAEYFAENGTRVPQIIAQDLTQGFLLLEDFGDELLSTVLNDATVDQYYIQAFKQIVQLQSIAVDGQIIPDYSAEKLLQEMHLFDEWLLPALAIDITAERKAVLDNAYQYLLKNIQAQPQVIVHRDYHSRNLMVLNNEQDLGVIDFQDAVRGADTYDLISIVRDAYVQWKAQQVDTWIEQFYAMLPDSQKQERDLNQFKIDVEVMALQRHLKVLGIFVRLFERDGKSGYLKDLPRVMWYFRQELMHPLLPDVPEMVALRDFVEDVVMAKFEQKYGNYIAIVAE
ncbi:MULTISPECIES: aminoglycoside phosphotransferase family protein [unclassified Acinetobacter]|uniref:aminoglycoside phosphotransferase family protein n=1 Tax=unclassified Acinetobacter TaxID=196816 RepID=UPI0035B85479